MFLRVALVSLICCAAPAALYAQECQISSYRFTFGEAASASMSVKAGAKCTSYTYANGQLIRQIAVAVPPKQGMASVESSHWSYQSKPGFTGTDEFVLLIAGQTISNPATLTVNVTVSD